MDSVLDVSHLTKLYGSFTAVDDISFRVEEGEIVGLLGPNGAGKTTTLTMIMSILKPTSGAITIFGKDLALHREEILKDMNFSSAYTRAPWRIKVWEHLLIFGLIYEIADLKQTIEKLLKTFDLMEMKESMIGDLSSGNIAKLNLAKAYINKPKLLLLDEPTSSMDPDIADHVREFILQSQKEFKTSILITSHNMAEIEELCDRVIFINHGKIITEDTPENLARRIEKARVRLMMKDGQKRTIAYCKAHRLPVVVSDRFVTITIPEKRIAELLANLAFKGVSYSEITVEKPTLEDFFIREVREVGEVGGKS